MVNIIFTNLKRNTVFILLGFGSEGLESRDKIKLEKLSHYIGLILCGKTAFMGKNVQND